MRGRSCILIAFTVFCAFAACAYVADAQEGETGTGYDALAPMRLGNGTKGDPKHVQDKVDGSDSDGASVNVHYLSMMFAVVLASMSPWLWIACNDTAKTSAWGTTAFEFSSPSLADQLSESQVLELQNENSARDASSVWIPIVITYMLAASILYLIKEPERWPELLTSYVLSFAMTGAIMYAAYQRFGCEPGQSEYDVRPALLLNFAIFGGLLGIAYAVAFQPWEHYLFDNTFPSCSLYFMSRDPVVRRPSRLLPVTPHCGALTGMAWILFQGLVEETGKAIWLFWRLRGRENDLPRKCFFGQCSARNGSDGCGGFFKLVQSPRHVLLCAFACGAGYDCLENIKHGFHRTPLPQEFATSHHFPGMHPSLILVMISEILTSTLHIVWTGIIGAGLAQHMFCRSRDRPSLMATILPSIVSHGVFDWGLAFLHNILMRTGMHVMERNTELLLAIFLTVVIVTTFLASCYLLHHRIRNLPCESQLSPSGQTPYGNEPFLFS